MADTQGSAFRRFKEWLGRAGSWVALGRARAAANFGRLIRWVGNVKDWEARTWLTALALLATLFGAAITADQRYRARQVSERLLTLEESLIDPYVVVTPSGQFGYLDFRPCRTDEGSTRSQHSIFETYLVVNDGHVDVSLLWLDDYGLYETHLGDNDEVLLKTRIIPSLDTPEFNVWVDDEDFFQTSMHLRPEDLRALGQPVFLNAGGYALVVLRRQIIFEVPESYSWDRALAEIEDTEFQLQMVFDFSRGYSYPVDKTVSARNMTMVPPNIYQGIDALDECS